MERLSTKNEFAERAAWTLWGLVRVCVWMVNMRLSCEQLVTYGFCGMCLKRVCVPMLPHKCKSMHTSFHISQHEAELQKALSLCVFEPRSPATPTGIDLESALGGKSKKAC